jgi:hypothetical protein
MPSGQHHQQIINEQKKAQLTHMVRKEYEKVLAQIEFPKPPKNDIYFIPNPNNIEFLMCLGLDEVVKCVQDKNNNLTITYEFPYQCKNCSNDYTPVWRKDNQDTICDKCFKYLEKKQIRAEHSQRLKQSLLKAVKEKEVIEQRLLAESLLVPTTNTPPTQQSQQMSQQSPIVPPSHHHVPTNHNSRLTTFLQRFIAQVVGFSNSSS